MHEPIFEPTGPFLDRDNLPFVCHYSDNVNDVFVIEAHWHHYIELLHVEMGEARLMLEGESSIMRTGDIVIINAGEIHSINIDPVPHTRYKVLQFDSEILYMNRSLFELKYVLPFTFKHTPLKKIFRKSQVDTSSVAGLLNEIFKEYSNRQYGYELAIQSDICKVFLWILRNWHDEGLYPGARLVEEIDVSRFKKVFDHVDENFSRELSAKEAAVVCGMSYSYFSRQFKKALGRTFTEYLCWKRIKEAERLLLTTELNITQAAMSVGFSSTSYFIKQFRKHKGLSPRNYRQMHRELLLDEGTDADNING